MIPCPYDGHERFRGGAGWVLQVVCAVLNCRCPGCRQRGRTEEDKGAPDERLVTLEEADWLRDNCEGRP